MDPAHTLLRPGRRFAIAIAVAGVIAACGGTTGDADSDQAASTTTTESSSEPTSEPTDALTASADASEPAASAEQQFPDVLEAELTPSGDTWSVAATISSPYDSPDRYADAFRVLAPDGTELGVRELTHDHASEQPFTRSLDDVAIPDDVDEVTVEGRDQANGYGGDTVTVAVPR